MTAPAWHSRTKEEAFAGLESIPQGLSAEGAARRLATHGPNRLQIVAVGDVRLEIEKFLRRRLLAN